MPICMSVELVEGLKGCYNWVFFRPAIRDLAGAKGGCLNASCGSGASSRAAGKSVSQRIRSRQCIVVFPGDISDFVGNYISRSTATTRTALVSLFSSGECVPKTELQGREGPGLAGAAAEAVPEEPKAPEETHAGTSFFTVDAKPFPHRRTNGRLSSTSRDEASDDSGGEKEEKEQCRRQSSPARDHLPNTSAPISNWLEELHIYPFSLEGICWVLSSKFLEADLLVIRACHVSPEGFAIYRHFVREDLDETGHPREWSSCDGFAEQRGVKERAEKPRRTTTTTGSSADDSTDAFFNVVTTGACEEKDCGHLQTDNFSQATLHLERLICAVYAKFRSGSPAVANFVMRHDGPQGEEGESERCHQQSVLSRVSKAEEEQMTARCSSSKQTDDTASILIGKQKDGAVCKTSVASVGDDGLDAVSTATASSSASLLSSLFGDDRCRATAAWSPEHDMHRNYGHYLPRLLLAGFSKGGIVLSSLIRECRRKRPVETQRKASEGFEEDTPEMEADTTRCKGDTDRFLSCLCSPVDRFWRRVDCVHYLDAALNAPNTLFSFSEANLEALSAMVTTANRQLEEEEEVGQRGYGGAVVRGSLCPSGSSGLLASTPPTETKELNTAASQHEKTETVFSSSRASSVVQSGAKCNTKEPRETSTFCIFFHYTPRQLASAFRWYLRAELHDVISKLRNARLSAMLLEYYTDYIISDEPFQVKGNSDTVDTDGGPPPCPGNCMHFSILKDFHHLSTASDNFEAEVESKGDFPTNREKPQRVLLFFQQWLMSCHS